MTEAEWLASDDPTRMVFGLPSTTTVRKVRLAACACCRRWEWLLTEEVARHTLDVTEQYADGRTGSHKLTAALRATAPLLARRLMPAWTAEDWLVRAITDASKASPDRYYNDTVFLPLEQGVAVGDGTGERRAQIAIIRDIFGNPFRPAAFDPRWRTPDALGLARAVYEDRAFDRMPLLADALMDAGCVDDQILEHCRGPGPHVRGCWVVDLVLDKA